MKKINITDVKCDYFDDAMGAWAVDVWENNEDAGNVAAWIYPKTYEVVYVFAYFKKEQKVLDAIKYKLKEIICSKK